MSDTVEKVEKEIIQEVEETKEIDEKEELENKKKAKKKIWVFLLVVGIILLGFVLYNEFIGKYKQTTENAYVNADKNPITSQVSGIVKEVYVLIHKMLKKDNCLQLLTIQITKLHLKQQRQE